MTMAVVRMRMTLASRHLPQWDNNDVLDDDNDDDVDNDEDTDNDDDDTCIKAPTSMGGLMQAQV